MRLGLGRKSAGRGRDRAAKNHHPCTGGAVVLDLPSLSRSVGQNYQTLPSLFNGYDIRPFHAVGYGLSWHWHRHSWEKQGVEPSYSTIRIPQTFPFRAVARPFLEVLL